jgi:hypothetical protein
MSVHSMTMVHLEATTGRVLHRFGLHTRTPRAVVWLSIAVALVAMAVSAAGLMAPGDEGKIDFTTARGQQIELYGRGLYEFETPFGAGANQGTDLLTLLAGIPLLAGALIAATRGSRRGQLVLLGALAYFLYVYATRALGAAYNDLFLAYVALFAASLAAFVLCFVSFDLDELTARFSTRMSRRLAGAFMIVSGLVTLAVWLVDPIVSLLDGSTPERLANNTTLFTSALDLAVIVPAALVAGVLILRERTLGYLMALSLLVLEVLLAPMIMLQTLFQVSAGESFSTGEIVGPIAGFSMIALAAVWVLVDALRNVSEQPPALAPGD